MNELKLENAKRQVQLTILTIYFEKAFCIKPVKNHLPNCQL